MRDFLPGGRDPVSPSKSKIMSRIKSKKMASDSTENTRVE